MKLFRNFYLVEEETLYSKSEAQGLAVKEFFDQTYEGTLSESLTLAELLDESLLPTGTTYNESLSEAVDLTDGSTTAVLFASSISQALALADAYSGALIIASTVQESTDVSESLSNTHVALANLSQALALADGFTNTANLLAGVNELLTVFDTLSGNAILVSTVAEAVAVQEGLNNAFIFYGTLEEAIAVQSAITGTSGAALPRTLHKLTLRPVRTNTTEEVINVYRFALKTTRLHVQVIGSNTYTYLIPAIKTHNNDMTQPSIVDLLVQRGDTFDTDEFRIEKAAFDFTGTTATMKVLHPVSKATVLEPTVTMENTTGSSTAKPTATAVQTQLLPPNNYPYQIDFVLPGGSVKTYFKGTLKVE